MQIFTVVVNKDDTVHVAAKDVIKETPQFYFVADTHDSSADSFRGSYAFGYSKRIDKGRFATTARGAVERYMERRQRDKENARAAVAQATKQIASANELLMHLPPLESDPSDPAVGEAVETTHG